MAKLLLKILVSALLLGYSFSKIPLGDLVTKIPQWEYSWFLWGLGISALVVCLQGLRWKQLLGSDVKVSLGDLIKYSWMGKYFELLIPISIGGEVMKANLLGNQIKNKGFSIASALQAKMLGVFSLFILGIFVGRPPEKGFIQILLWCGFFVSFALSLIPLWFPKGLIKKIFKGRFANVQLWLRGEFFTWKSWALALVFSLAIQFLSGIVHLLFYWGVSAPLGFAENFLFFPWLAVLMLLPISLFGLGVKETYSIETMTSIPGLTVEHCLESAMASYLLVLSLALIGFLVYLKSRKK